MLTEQVSTYLKLIRAEETRVLLLDVEVHRPRGDE